MNIEQLQAADRVLSKCGRPTIRGAVGVPFPKSFVMPMLLQPNASTTFTKEITGDTVFALHAISSSVGAQNAATGVRMQIQLPNGRFLMGGQNGQDVGQFGWIGSWRYRMDPVMRCQPGDKFQVTLTDVAGLAAAYPLTLTFDGADEYYLRGNSLLGPVELASMLPRYQGIVNENILAPCWVGGYGPETPRGFEDRRFTYSSDTVTVDVATTALTGTAVLHIDSGLDFLCRRLLFQVSADNTVTAGSFKARIRTGSGYLLTDTAIDVARYINAAPMAHDWLIQGDDTVYADLLLVDGAGTGNMSITMHLEGVRRRRA